MWNVFEEGMSAKRKSAGKGAAKISKVPVCLTVQRMSAEQSGRQKNMNLRKAEFLWTM